MASGPGVAKRREQGGTNAQLTRAASVCRRIHVTDRDEAVSWTRTEAGWDWAALELCWRRGLQPVGLVALGWNKPAQARPRWCRAAGLRGSAGSAGGGLGTGQRWGASVRKVNPPAGASPAATRRRCLAVRRGPPEREPATGRGAARPPPPPPGRAEGAFAAGTAAGTGALATPRRGLHRRR